jgi:mono/diheme cytochrome c family protein
MRIIYGKRFMAKLILIGIAFFIVSTAVAQHKEPWNVPETAKNQKNPFTADNSSLLRGKRSYNVECLKCHGDKGKGDGIRAEKIDKQITDLGSVYVQSQSDGELFWKISESRRPMPLNKHTLTDDQRWDVINYIRSFKHN